MKIRGLYVYVKDKSFVFKPFNPDFENVARKISEYQKKPTNMKYTGTLSKSGEKKIRRSIYVWLMSLYCKKHSLKHIKQSLEMYPTFITLTMSDEYRDDDKNIKNKILKNFLYNLKYVCNYKYYFWRAEKQQNGRIHFHLIIDKYVHYSKVQEIWNKLQYKNNYMQKYLKVHGNINAPSTHIKKVDTMVGTIKYLIKYSSKELCKHEIKGRQYAMSQELTTLKYYQECCDFEMESIYAKYVEKNNGYKSANEYATCFYFNNPINLNSIDSPEREKIFAYYSSIYDTLYNVKPKTNILPAQPAFYANDVKKADNQYVQSKLALHTIANF